MTARRTKLSTLVAAAALTVWGGSAQAGVIAQSVLEVTDFTFVDAGGAPLNVDQFDQLVFQDSSDATATLNGVSDTGTISSTTFGPLDLPQQCVGDCVFGENDYSHHNVQTVTVARGDTLLTGSPLAGTPFPTGANAHSLAEAQLGSDGDEGSTQSNLGLVATFSFELAEGGVIGVSFDADQWLKAAITPDMSLGTTAQASSGWTIELAQGGVTLFTWTPDGAAGGITGGTEILDECDLTRSIAAQVPGQDITAACTGSFLAFTNFALTAGTLYTLNLRHTTEADANAIIAQVPEPSVVALLGIGLLGMGLGARRNRKIDA